MGTNAELRKAIQQVAGTIGGDDLRVVLCTVDSVDEDALTCDVTTVSDAAQSVIQGVQLMAGVGDGLLLTPVVDSQVLVAYSNTIQPYVLMLSDVDKFSIVTTGGVELNGDDYGGLVKVQDLVDKINALENLINSILDVLKNTTIPLAPSGTYPFAPLYAAIMAISPTTTVSDLENTTVKHGTGV